MKIGNDGALCWDDVGNRSLMLWRDILFDVRLLNDDGSCQDPRIIHEFMNGEVYVLNEVML